MSEPDDSRVRRAAAFDALYRAEFARLAGALRLHTGNRHLAEEVAQEVFERAWMRWGRLELLDRPEGWLYTTGFRLARRRLGRRHVRAEVSLEEGDRVGGNDPAGPAVDRVAIERALLTLPDRQRQAVILRQVLGFDPAAGAGMLGCSPEAFRQLCHRGLAALRAGGGLAVEVGEG